MKILHWSVEEGKAIALITLYFAACFAVIMLLKQLWLVDYGVEFGGIADGRLPPVGDTVDVANALWTNTIGGPELITVWREPDFDPSRRAFYYARVIEIPTPRWTAYDAKRFGTRMPPEAPMTSQARAYTSPIWYTPSR